VSTDWITMTEAARLAGVTVEAVHKAIARGELREVPAPAEMLPVRGRRSRVVARADVEAWRDRRRRYFTESVRRLGEGVPGR
jgi:hypothetical protein